MLLGQIWSFCVKPEDRNDGRPPEKFDPQTDDKVRVDMFPQNTDRGRIVRPTDGFAVTVSSSACIDQCSSRTPSAEGVWGVGCGVSPPHRGRGLCPSPEFFFDFGSQCGEFWCILGDIFYSSSTVQLPVLHAKPEFNRYRRIKAVIVNR